MYKINSQITFFYTTSIENTDHFYLDILGLSLVLDQGNCHIYQVAENGFLGFCQRDTAPIPGNVIFTMVTNDVDTMFKLLINHGIESDGLPRQNDDYGIYHFFVKDPNGYMLEIQQFNDPNWYMR